MIKAIETSYRGCRLRSRLEARWAVFFDALGLDWLYEPEGFALPSGPYLPDFFISRKGLSGIGPWVEVKGVPPQAHDLALLSELCQQTDAYGLLVVGNPGGDHFAFDRSGRAKEPMSLDLLARFLTVAHMRNTDTGLAGSEDFVVAQRTATGARFEFGERR